MNTKKILLLLVFILIPTFVVLTSCGKDDEPGLSIVGTWRCNSNTSDSALSYDIVTFNKDNTGTWQFVSNDGLIVQMEIISWTTVSPSLLEMRVRLKGTSTNPERRDYRYELLSSKELVLGDYLYQRQ